MSRDEDTLGSGFIKVPVPIGQFMNWAQRGKADNESEGDAESKKEEKEHKWELTISALLFCRAVCWALALVCLCAFILLWILQWSSDDFEIPPGLNGWMTLGVALATLGAVSIRATIAHRRMVALVKKVRCELRTAIREQAPPADVIELARIVTLVKRAITAAEDNSKQLAGLRADMDELMRTKADADRFVEQFSAAEERRVSPPIPFPGRARPSPTRKDDHS